MNYAFVNSDNKVVWVVKDKSGDDPEGFTSYEVPDHTSAQKIYFKDGKIKFYTEEQLAAKEQVPPYAALWNDDLMQYVDQRTLSDAKIRHNQKINNWWIDANSSFFSFQGKEFSVDPLSRSNIDGINGYVTLMNTFPPDWADVWKANDNTLIEMSDIEVWKNFYAAMVAQGNTNFLYAQQLKADLNNAQTITEVEAIVW